MKKYILPAFCSLLLSLPSQAQKNGQAIPAPTAEYYMNHYQFDEAEELLNQDIKKLKRKRQPTDVEEGKLQEIARLRSMMRATEQSGRRQEYVPEPHQTQSGKRGDQSV